jgi:pilus assembly protein Flp/PilA
MTRLLKQLAGDRSGATAIEYGLIAAFIALALVATLPAIKKNLGEVYSDVNRELSKAARQQ